MSRVLSAALLAAVVAGCSGRQRPVALPPLAAEGEVILYLQPFPQDAGRLVFRVEGVAAESAGKAQGTLELRLPEVAAHALRGQRMLARGRLPEGTYDGFSIRVTEASLAGEGGTSALLVPPGPVRVPLHLPVRAGEATVVRLTLREGAIEQGFRFSPAFAAAVPAPVGASAADYCTSPARHEVDVVERGTYDVTAVLATGSTPRGIAVDAIAGRAYVALSGEDQVEMIDLATPASRRRIRLLPGDEPSELALTPDRTQLLVLDRHSRTLSFVSTLSLREVARLAVGDDPWWLAVDAEGTRAYVLNRRSSTLVAVDLANRALAGSVGTDREPIRAALSPDGTRLWVIHAGSAYLSVFSLPDLALQKRVFVGLGMTAIAIDPRTSFVHVARDDERRVTVFDPFSALPLDGFPVPGPVSSMAVDTLENALLVAMPGQSALSVVDLTSRRLRATADVGEATWQVVAAGER